MKLSVKVDGIGEVTGTLRSLPNRIHKARSWALGSTGKWLRGVTLREAPKEPKLNPFTGTISSIRGRDGKTRPIPGLYKGRGRNKWRHGARNKEGGYFPAKRSTRTDPLTKLKSAIRSAVFDIKGELRVGFLRRRLWKRMTEQEEGFSTTVTRRMSKMLFSIGVPLGALRVLRTPARPWITKVLSKYRETMVAVYEAKFAEKLERVKNL